MSVNMGEHIWKKKHIKIYLHFLSFLDTYVADEIHSEARPNYATFFINDLIARFMGPTWGPSGADRT